MSDIFIFLLGMGIGFMLGAAIGAVCVADSLRRVADCLKVLGALVMAKGA